MRIYSIFLPFPFDLHLRRRVEVGVGFSVAFPHKEAPFVAHLSVQYNVKVRMLQDAHAGTFGELKLQIVLEKHPGCAVCQYAGKVPVLGPLAELLPPLWDAQ